MPTDEPNAAAIAEVRELGRQAAAQMFEALIRVFSLQMALVNNNVLTQEQIDQQYQAVGDIEAVRAERKRYGSVEAELGSVLDTLLRNYGGPVQ